MSRRQIRRSQIDRCWLQPARDISDVSGDYDKAIRGAHAAEYALPSGYALDLGRYCDYIRDPQGYECAIIDHRSGRPQLVSRGGTETRQPVLVKA